ncbi:hypothetical protein K439DRAFT_1641029 [Ramaria rubella]|nr:hypothetical protein K439DRAFT_1641029 [Ramaria rubella]
MIHAKALCLSHLNEARACSQDPFCTSHVGTAVAVGGCVGRIERMIWCRSLRTRSGAMRCQCDIAHAYQTKKQTYHTQCQIDIDIGPLLRADCTIPSRLLVSTCASTPHQLFNNLIETSMQRPQALSGVRDQVLVCLRKATPSPLARLTRPVISLTSVPIENSAPRMTTSSAVSLASPSPFPGRILFGRYDDGTSNVWDTLKGERVGVRTGYGNRVSYVFQRMGWHCTGSWDSTLRVRC